MIIKEMCKDCPTKFPEDLQEEKAQRRIQDHVKHVLWKFTCLKLTIETLEQGVKYIQR